MNTIPTLRVHRARLRARREAAIGNANDEAATCHSESRTHSQSLGTLATVLLSLAAALVFTGCLNLKPATDQTRNFLLTPSATAAASGGMTGLSVGVAPVQLPAHTASSWIAIRTGTNELRYSETARWAEPLNRNLQQVLGANLRAQPGIGAVFLNTWPSAAAQRVLNLQVETLELGADGTVRLAAHWTLRWSQGSEWVTTHTSSVERQGPKPADDMPGTVAALSEALAELSREVAESLMKPAPVQ
jgi:uncharacterized lipoprotein YmbA